MMQFVSSSSSRSGVIVISNQINQLTNEAVKPSASGNDEICCLHRGVSLVLADLAHREIVQETVSSVRYSLADEDRKRR